MRGLSASALAAAAMILSAGQGAAAQTAARSPDRGPLIAFNAAFVPGSTAAQRAASYRRLRAMGVAAIRLDFRWISIERIGRPLHRYVWAAQDREVRSIRAAGMRVLGILDYGHPNYSRAGWDAYLKGQMPGGQFGVGDPQYYPPDDPRSFARFASAVARRYRSDVIGWEVWNEENEGWRFWEPKEDPTAYGRLLCAAHRALARVDPAAPVLLGGLFYPPLLGGRLGSGAIGFLTALLDQRAVSVRRCFDAIAYHPYPYPFTSPEAQVPGRGSVIGAFDRLRAILRAHRLGHVPLWITEIGWPTNPQGNGVTERRQARYAARLELLSWTRAIPFLAWYTWGDAADPSGRSQEAHFGFFRANGTPKPASRALVVLDRLLGASGWRFIADRSRGLRLPRGRAGVDEGFALEFAAPLGRRLLALWYANERPPASPSTLAPVEPGTPPRTIAVRLELPAGATIIDMLGHRFRIRPGAHRLKVGQDPIYVCY